MAPRYTQQNRFSSSPSSFKVKRAWSWRSFTGGLLLSTLLVGGGIAYWFTNAGTPIAEAQTEIQITTVVITATPEPIRMAAPTQPAPTPAPRTTVVVLDMQEFTGIDPASGVSVDADTQTLLKEFNDPANNSDTESLTNNQANMVPQNAPDEVKQAAAADVEKPSQCESNGVWHLPVRPQNARISAIFGQYSNDSPYYQSLKQVGGITENAQGVFHPGIDFGTGLNAPVYAVADSVVVSTDFSDQYGNHVILSVGNGSNKQVLYGHLSDIFVAKGQPIKCGQIIGITGNTGKATTGPHLHFEVRVKGQPINPAKIVQLSKAARLPSWERGMAR